MHRNWVQQFLVFFAQESDRLKIVPLPLGQKNRKMVMKRVLSMLFVLSLVFQACRTHDPSDEDRQWVVVVGDEDPTIDPPTVKPLTEYGAELEEVDMGGNIINTTFFDYCLSYDQMGVLVNVQYEQDFDAMLPEFVESIFDPDANELMIEELDGFSNPLRTLTYTLNSDGMATQMDIDFEDPTDGETKRLTEQYSYDNEGFLSRIDAVQLIDPDEPGESVEYSRVTSNLRIGNQVTTTITNAQNNQQMREILYTFGTTTNDTPYDFAAYFHRFGLTGKIHPNLPVSRAVTNVSGQLTPLFDFTWTWQTGANGPIEYDGVSETPGPNEVEHIADLFYSSSCE